MAQDNPKIDEFNYHQAQDVNRGLRGSEDQPVLHGGQRPGVESRMDEAIEDNDDLKVARQNYQRNRVFEQDAVDE